MPTPEPPAPPSEPRDPGRRARSLAIVAAPVAIVAALAVFLLIRRPHVSGPVGSGDPPPLTEEEERAAYREADTRKLVKAAVEEGVAACERKEWTLCSERLSQAQHDDPSVATDPRVLAARRAYAVAVDKAKLEEVGF